MRLLGDAWHPLHGTLGWLRVAVREQAPWALCPRITLRVSTAPVDSAERSADVGSIEQIIDDLQQRALATVATHWRFDS